MNWPRVSIIIPSWNARSHLERCLPSVLNSLYPDREILLVDNGSTDGSAEWVEARYPEVRLIRLPENQGFASGCNAGLREATGDYVAFLNNDVEVSPYWLQPLISALEEDPTLGAVQPKIMDYRHRERFEYAGAAGGYLDRYGYPFARGRIFSTLEEDHGQYNQPADIFWASGAAMVVRRKLAEQLGGFEVSFEMHQEEIDFCWRLQNLGYRIRAIPHSVVYHIGGGSLSYGETRKLYYNHRNGLYVLYRNLPPRGFWRRLLVRFGLDVGAALFYLLQGRPDWAGAVLRAYRDAWALRSELRAARRRLLAERIRWGDPPTLYPGSIVLAYYVFRRRRFSDLDWTIP
jgi:GT2 family glycosyltransferase|nr:MAG: glycosyl hydrolase [Bacteroidota bacterium]